MTDSNSEIKAVAKETQTKESVVLNIAQKPETVQDDAVVEDHKDREKQDGEWLEHHTWETEEPNSELKMKASVSNSNSYPTPRKWTKNNGKSVDLAKIFANLPSFIEEAMGGGMNGCRRELKRVLQTQSSEPAIDTPHVLEIKNESLPPNDQKVSKKEKFTARSLTSSPEDPKVGNFFYFDCEHILETYVPTSKLSWFQTQIESYTRWIQKIKYDEYKQKRWVFTPSFRRANIALLQWPHDEIINDTSTITILVVRPSEFDAYVEFCGPHFPVIRLPQDEIGAGYARYWIQKIATRLELQFIWMIDDSVKCFVEYDPKKPPPNGLYKKFRKRKFGLVLERIEKFVKETDGKEVPIVAMSPRRFIVRFTLENAFTCKPPQGAVYLNLKKLQEKQVFYRPELKTLEDVIFGYECEKQNLKVFVDNRVHLQDHPWKDTGARSPSVKKRKLHDTSFVEERNLQSSSSAKEQKL